MAAGPAGQTALLVLLAAGLYLVIRKTAPWDGMLCCLAGAAAAAFLFPRVVGPRWESVLFEDVYKRQLVCFAVATILFTPPLRSYPFYQVLSFYFLFEGAWTLLNAAVDLIWPGSNVLVWVHYVGVIVFAGLLFYKIYAYYWKQKHGGGEKRKTVPRRKVKSSRGDETRWPMYMPGCFSWRL